MVTEDIESLVRAWNVPEDVAVDVVRASARQRITFGQARDMLDDKRGMKIGRYPTRDGGYIEHLDKRPYSKARAAKGRKKVAAAKATSAASHPKRTATQRIMKKPSKIDRAQKVVGRFWLIIGVSVTVLIAVFGLLEIAAGIAGDGTLGDGIACVVVAAIFGSFLLFLL